MTRINRHNKSTGRSWDELLGGRDQFCTGCIVTRKGWLGTPWWLWCPGPLFIGRLWWLWSKNKLLKNLYVSSEVSRKWVGDELASYFCSPMLILRVWDIYLWGLVLWYIRYISDVCQILSLLFSNFHRGVSCRFQVLETEFIPVCLPIWRAGEGAIKAKRVWIYWDS